MYYKVTHFEKALHVESTKPYGVIKVYFGNQIEPWIRKVSITKFMALSHILENDVVGYNPQTKIFNTPVEHALFVEASNHDIS